jgi:hypothetical protein
MRSYNHVPAKLAWQSRVGIKLWSPMDEGFHSGLSLTFTGRAELNPAVDTPLNARVVWSKTGPFSNLAASDWVTLVSPQLVQNSITSLSHY